MKKAFFLFLIFLLNGYAQRGPRIRNIECQIKRGNKSQIKVFSMHDNYSRIIYFENLQLSLLADHMGFPGAPGTGYRYAIFLPDQKGGGLVQGPTNGTFARPLALEDGTWQDTLLDIRARCKGR